MSNQMYAQGSEAKSTVRISDLALRIDRALTVIDAILDGRDGDVRTDAPENIKQPYMADDAVDMIRKHLEEIANHAEGLHTRLRKIARSL